MESNRAITWRKSSYSGNSGGQCVEVGSDTRRVAVRDSKDPAGAVLAFAAGTWAAFAGRVKAGA